MYHSEMCAQRKFSSACASAESVQSFHRVVFDSQGSKVYPGWQWRPGQNYTGNSMLWISVGHTFHKVHFRTLSRVMYNEGLAQRSLIRTSTFCLFFYIVRTSEIKGDMIRLIEFSQFCTKRTTFLPTCLLYCTSKPFWKEA